MREREGKSCRWRRSPALHSIALGLHDRESGRNAAYFVVRYLLMYGFVWPSFSPIMALNFSFATRTASAKRLWSMRAERPTRSRRAVATDAWRRAVAVAPLSGAKRLWSMRTTNDRRVGVERSRAVASDNAAQHHLHREEIRAQAATLYRSDASVERLVIGEEAPWMPAVSLAVNERPTRKTRKAHICSRVLPTTRFSDISRSAGAHSWSSCGRTFVFF